MKFLHHPCDPGRKPGFAACLAIGLSILLVAGAGASGPVDVWARTIIHADGSRTVSKKDTDSRVIEQLTYNQNDALVMKRIIQVDSKEKSRRGFIFDKDNNLIYKISFVYDEIDRLQEEILYNVNDQVVRRLIYSYDAEGKQLQPKAFTFAGAVPSNVSAALSPEAALSGPEKAGDGSSMSALTPGTLPSSGAPEKKKKRGFFNIFKKKKK